MTYQNVLNEDFFNLYTRQSVYKEESESIENQIKTCKDYIFAKFPKAKDENIFVYKDEGFSGKNTNRPQFQKMMEDIKKNKIKYFVCYKIDRVARSVVDFANFIKKLESKKIKFISVKDNIDTSTYLGKAMLYIVAIFAELERTQIAERVKDSLMYLATKGRFLGGPPPMGFTAYSEEKIVIDGKIKSSKFLKTNEHIETVKLIFEKYLESGSLKYVATYLNENGFKNYNNKEFFPTVLQHTLKNPVYCSADEDSFEYFKSKGSNIYFSEKDFKKKLGLVSFNRRSSAQNTINDESEWVVSIGKHPGIISGKDWISVQKSFSKMKSKSRTYCKNAMLSGFIDCENCGTHMTVRTSAWLPKDKFKYVCRRKDRLGIGQCNISNMPGPETDQFVINYVMNFDEDKLKKHLNIGRFTRKTNKFDDKIYDINFKIKELESDKNKYLEHLIKTEPNSSFARNIKSKMDSIDKKIDNLKDQKQVYEAQFNLASNEKSDVEQILKNLANFKKNYHNLDFEHKKSLLRLIINKLTWNGNELKIFLTGEPS